MKEWIAILLALGAFVFAYNAQSKKDAKSAQLETKLCDTMQKAERFRQELQSEIRRCLDKTERRVADLEQKIRKASENGASDGSHEEINRKLGLLSEQVSSISMIQARINDLSNRIDTMESHTTADHSVLRRRSDAVEREMPNEKMVGDSIADLKKRLNDIEKEIKQLRELNPACILNTIDPPSNIRNTVMKMTTLKYKPYCMKAQTTYVRDLFYCTKCHSELRMNDYPCCEVSRKKSFREWQKLRQGVDTTKEIKEKIDALLLEKQKITEQIKARKRL